MDVFIAHSEQHVLGAIKGVKCLLIKCHSEGIDQGVHLTPMLSDKPQIWGAFQKRLRALTSKSS